MPNFFKSFLNGVFVGESEFNFALRLAQRSEIEELLLSGCSGMPDISVLNDFLKFYDDGEKILSLVDTKENKVFGFVTILELVNSGLGRNGKVFTTKTFVKDDFYNFRLSTILKETARKATEKVNAEYCVLVNPDNDKAKNAMTNVYEKFFIAETFDGTLAYFPEGKVKPENTDDLLLTLFKGFLTLKNN